MDGSEMTDQEDRLADFAAQARAIQRNRERAEQEQAEAMATTRDNPVARDIARRWKADHDALVTERDALRAEVERLRAATPDAVIAALAPWTCCRHCPDDDPTYHAENPPNSHGVPCKSCAEERWAVGEARDRADALQHQHADVRAGVDALAVWAVYEGVFYKRLDPGEEPIGDLIEDNLDIVTVHYTSAFDLAMGANGIAQLGYREAGRKKVVP